MKTVKLQHLLLGAAPVALFLSYSALAQGSAPQDPAPSPDPAQGSNKLTRVQPQAGGGLLAGDEAFEAEHWRVLLAAPDHEERERSFGRVVELAAARPEVRAFLEQLEREGGELGWTARLALREADARRHRGLLGFHRADPFSNRIQDLLERIDPSFHAFTNPQTLGWPGWVPQLVPPGGSGGDGTSQGRSVRVEQGPDGYRIEVTETEDGETTTREYEGPDLEEILEANPELREQLGILDGDLPGTLQLRFDGALGQALDLDRMFRGLEAFRDLRPSVSLQLGPHGSLRFEPTPQAPSRPMRTDVLGVRVAPLTPEAAADVGVPSGLRVHVTYPGTIAHILGLGAGDVIVEVNGRTVAEANDITAALRANEDGSVTVVWIDGLGQRHRQTWSPQATPEPPQDEER